MARTLTFLKSIPITSIFSPHIHIHYPILPKKSQQLNPTVSLNSPPPQTLLPKLHTSISQSSQHPHTKSIYLQIPFQILYLTLNFQFKIPKFQLTLIYPHQSLALTLTFLKSTPITSKFYPRIQFHYPIFLQNSQQLNPTIPRNIFFLKPPTKISTIFFSLISTPKIIITIPIYSKSKSLSIHTLFFRPTSLLINIHQIRA